MILGRVTGTVVASHKAPSFEGMKLLVVRQVDLDASDTDSFVVAVDAVGVGTGEVVLCAQGSSARQTELTDGKPCDAVIMAVVDTVEVDGTVRYHKADEVS